MQKKTLMALVQAVAVCIASAGWCQPAPPSPAGPRQLYTEVIPRTWLKQKTTVQQAEQANLVSDPRLGPKPVPFGFIHDDWKKFKAGMRPGDELWEFESPSHTWADLAGRAGFCIMRQGRIIDAFTTRMN